MTFTSLSGRVSPHQGHKHKQRTDNIRTQCCCRRLVVVVVVVVVVVLLLPVKYFVKNCVFSGDTRSFSGMFVLLEEKTLVFRMFLQHQGRTSSKTPLFRLCFSECVENIVFCGAFLTRGLRCIVNIGLFFTLITSSSQSKPAKNTGI